MRSSSLSLSSIHLSLTFLLSWDTRTCLLRGVLCRSWGSRGWRFQDLSRDRCCCRLLVDSLQTTLFHPSIQSRVINRPFCSSILASCTWTRKSSEVRSLRLKWKLRNDGLQKRGRRSCKDRSQHWCKQTWKLPKLLWAMAATVGCVDDML